MKLAAKIVKDIRRSMEQEARLLNRGLQVGTRETGEALKNSLRKQIRESGMSRKFSNSWQAKHYKNDGYNPAALVYSKAPEIIQSFDKGLIIRVDKREWLAIPTKYTPKKIGKYRATPARLIRESRYKFRFVQTDDNNALLIAKPPRRKKPVVMFVLVKSVKMPKKLNVAAAAERWAGKMPEVIQRELAKVITRAENE